MDTDARLRVRGIITKEGCAVLIHRIRPERPDYWVAPGGGVKPSDPSLHEALRREIKEELGVDVIVGAEALVLGNDTFYYCTLSGGKLGTGDGPEYHRPGSYGSYIVEVIPIDKLAEMNVLPTEVLTLFQR